uniref:Aminoacyl-tRNA synthetase, class 1a, anticodon-binding n=1 Tax=Tanacetum cinerariifolium TaxID=118510 RepID=A0A699HJQ2_TANCI|nr:aminoacyl-tRNA synthetase, class 1a, anticodon-binding [Tanacetum cinerariifolium]
MYPQFLQTILGIETRVSRQYKVLVFSTKLFANMRLNFGGNLMPLLPAMLLQAQAGKGTEVAAQDVPHPVPAPDQSLANLPTPSRPQSPDPVAPVLEHDHSSVQPETTVGSFPTTEDTPMGGDFHTSPPRSSYAPPACQPSGEAKLHDHKKLFKDVVGKLVKKVKSLEVKLKTKKRKLVVSDSDLEDSTTQDMDLDALRTSNNAAVAADSDIPSGNTSQVLAASPCAPTVGPSGTYEVPPAPSTILPGASSVSLGPSVTPTTASVVPVDILKVPAAVPSDSPNVPAGVSSKGKSLMVDEDIHVIARSFRQREDDRLGEEAAKRFHEEDMAKLERERAEAQRKRQQEVLESAKFYNEDDWLNIRAQVEANASLSQTLMGDDVTEDNFPTRMAALIKKKRPALAEQLFKERHNQPLTPAQQKAYMRQYRPGPMLEEPFTKRPKSPEAHTPSMPEVSASLVVTSPPSSRTRRKSLGCKHVHKPKSTLSRLDLAAPAQTFLKVVVDEDSDDEDSVDEVWSAVVGWELLSTPLGEINALYCIDGSTKHFATLCQLLYMVDRQDLTKLYGLVPGGKGSCVWNNQTQWEIRIWRLYTLSNVHVLETVSGEVLLMFTDVSYPLSVELMKKMLTHKLKIDSDFVGNDLTTAEQLIQFIKNQIVTAQASSV